MTARGEPPGEMATEPRASRMPETVEAERRDGSPDRRFGVAREGVPEQGPRRRDTRIDVLRALALLSIYINHIPGNAFERLTHKNFGFSDAAEAFVLLSGMAAGLAYGTRFAAGQRLVVCIKALRRAGRLYVTHIATTIATLGIFLGGAIYFRHPELLREINIDVLVARPAEGLLGVATLGHQLGYNNILPVYLGLMLALPLMLALAQRSVFLLLAVSGGVWLAAGILRLAPPNYPTPGVWFMNPLSWQFLFAIGIALTLPARRHGGGWQAHRGLVLAAAAYLVLALLWVRIPLWGIDTSMGLPAVLTGFDKTFLSLPRLLHVLALATVIAASPVARWMAVSERHPLAVLGKHSLPVFVAGTLLAMVAQVTRQVAAPTPPVDAALLLGGMLILFALAYLLDWMDQLGSAGRTGPSAARRPQDAPARSAVVAGRA